MQNLLSLTAILLVACYSSAAFGQWRSDSTTNTSVNTSRNIQQYPDAASDGSNGVIVVWQDYRSGSDWDIYAQRLDANGVKMWADTGVPICRIGGVQSAVQVVGDGAGGAYIIWEDRRTGANGVDIYAQYISSTGSIGYDVNGVAIGSGTRDQETASITADGRGNAFVAFEDNRPSNTATRPDIYMNYLTPAGRQWGTGRAVITQSGQQRRPKLIEDGSGGSLLAWENNLGVPASIWATRVSSGGSVQWGTQGATIFRGSLPAIVSRHVSLARDGSQFLFAWEVTNVDASKGQDILASRVGSDSTKLWYSPAEVTGAWPGDQTSPRIVSDDSGGAIVVFEDFTSDISPNFYNFDLAAVRMLSNGVDRLPKFSDGFAMVARQTRGQRKHQIVKSDNGFIAAWEDGRQAAGDSSVYAQRMDRSMRRQFPTTNTSSTWGLPISASSTVTAKQVQLVPRTNGAIAIWADSRNGALDIYAQLLFRDATLPIELASFEARATDRGEVVLDWTTASESKNAGFEIERRALSLTNAEYLVVASYVSNNSLRGAGTSNAPRRYSAVDRPAMGRYEYRIVDVSLDGLRTAHVPRQVEVSNTVLQKWSLGEVYPNPVRGNMLNISVSTPQSSIVKVRLWNALGLEMHASVHAVGVGEGTLVIPMDSPSLTNGCYFLQMVGADESGVEQWRSPVRVISVMR